MSAPNNQQVSFSIPYTGSKKLLELFISLSKGLPSITIDQHQISFDIENNIAANPDWIENRYNGIKESIDFCILNSKSKINSFNNDVKQKILGFIKQRKSELLNQSETA